MKPIVTLYLLSFLFAASPLARPESGKDDINIFTRFKLQVFEDDKPTTFFIVGHISIFRESGRLKAHWNDVWISPLDSEKKLLLKPEFSSTDLGDIRNLVVGEGRFSFEYVLEPERVMRVSGTKQADGEDYEIQAVGLWWIDLLKNTVKTEWRPVTKPIVLPYTELF